MVRRPRPDGGVTVYWYAWRSGPQILKVTAKNDALLSIEISRAMPAAIAAYTAERGSSADNHAFLYGLITRYLTSPTFEAGAPRTRRDRRKFLDLARDELGDMELRALESRRARALLIGWRDRYQATPKTADERLGALSVVLQWAADRGEIRENPVKGFPRIYRVNRADVIWTPEHLATIRPHCAQELDHAIRLAALTGLRLGDLRRVAWSAVGDQAITLQTGKSRGRRTVIIPIYDALRDLLAEIPRVTSVTILNSARKRPWSEPGLGSAIRRAKLDAAAAAIKATGDAKAATGIEPLRWHDLRGTAATNFIRAGLDLAEVATILGWKEGKVREIAARYVTAEVFGQAMIQKLRRNETETETVKESVKRTSAGAQEPP